MDGDLLHRGGEVARRVLGHIVEVIGLFRLQTAHIEVHVPALGHGDAAALEGIHPRGHLELGRVAGQVHRAGLAGQGLGVLLTLGHHHPVQGARLVEVGVHAHRGAVHLVDGGLGVEDGGRLVHGGEAELLDRRALGAVHVGEPQVEVVALQLLQGHAVHIKGIGGVLGHVQGAEAQIAGDGVGLEVAGGGGGGALGQQRPVQPAGLGGHSGDLGGDIGDPGEIGVVGGEVGHAVVRRGEGDDLQGALVPSGVHQDGGEVVGAVGGEAADLCRAGLAGPAQGQGALLDHLGGVGLGVDELIHPDGAVGHRADGPVDGAPLVGAEAHRGAGGRQVGDLGIARQQAGVGGGLGRRRAVHLLPVDGGGDAGADHDLVGQHGDGAVIGVHRQIGDVAVAGDGGAHVQVHVAHLGPGGDAQGGVRGLLVHGHRLHLAGRHVDGGAGGQVDDLLHVARQLQAALLLPVQLNAAQAVAGGRVVGDKAVGAHAGGADDAVALHPEGDLLVFDVVHNELGGVHIAQDDAVVAPLADAAAADHDLAQHGDVFQLDVPQVHAGGDVEVAGDDGVPQGDAGFGDDHVSVDAAQGVLTRLLDRGAHGLGDHNGHLAPGDGVLGPEAAVGIAGEEVVARRRAHQAAAPVAQIPPVGEIGVLTHRRLHHQVPGQDDRRLLPGDLGKGGEGVGRRTGDIPRRIGDGHILGIPVGVLHVIKGGGPHRLIAEGAVDDGDELRPGDVVVRIQVSVNIAPHKAPVHQLIQIGLCVICRGGQDRLGQHAHQHGQQQQKGAHAPKIPLHVPHFLSSLPLSPGDRVSRPGSEG